MTLVSYEQLLRAPCREPDHVSPIDGVSEPDWRWYPGPSAAATDPVKLGSGEEHVDRGSAQVLVLVIHGGCWSAAFDRTHLMPFCTYLSGRGAHVLLPEYRRCGQAGAGWPGTFSDVAAAARRAHQWADEENLRLAIVGHSAGGHLALWLNSRGLSRGVETFIPEPLACVDRVVGLAPITNLDSYRQEEGDCQVMVDQLMAAGEPLEPAAVSPYFGEAVADEVIVAGGRDPIVGEQQTLFYAREKGCASIVQHNAGHFDALLPGEPACDELAQILLND